ncbi:MAG: hypothetical protein ACREUM_08155 [Nitrosospira sp.]
MRRLAWNARDYCNGFSPGPDLSAAWWLKDGESPESDLIVAELAMVELAKH